MKKLLILIIFLLVGCSNHEYSDFVNEAKISSKSDIFPFHVEMYIDDSDSNLIYQAIIDEPTESLGDIQAMVIHDQKTNNIFPSIGVLDEKFRFSDETKGINLIGYVEKKDHIQFKVYVKINDQSYTYLYDYYSTNP